MKWLRRNRRAVGAEASRRARRGGWLSGLFGSRSIDNLIDENFPSWEEYSAQKAREMEEAKQADKFELPPYKVTISSPLQRNFLYALTVAGALGMGYGVPEWSSVLLYGAIVSAFVIAIFTIVRDGVFLHLEGQRLEVDGEWINHHTHGPGQGTDEEEQGGFLKTFSRKKKTIFRSRLLQIHYQNVLRAFDQGARRAWVYQDASIAEIQTLLSQRGMKIAWTVIEVLPQLGLLGTLVGLMAMFLAFRSAATAPEVAIISGFGIALGTTVLANLFVLILRPLHMQNERAMNEILSTLQSLMAIFILPTQQYAMERSMGRAPQIGASIVPHSAPAALTTAGEQRINRTLEQLAGTVRDFIAFQEKLDNGAVARETSRIAMDVQSALRSFQESVNPVQLAQQQRALGKLTDSVQDLSDKLSVYDKAVPRPAEHSDRIEQDLTQLRVLTRDTLVLLEQIANRLSDNHEGARNMLSLKVGVHAQVFPDMAEHDTLSAGSSEAARAPERPDRKEQLERAEPPERVERTERPDRIERTEVSPPKIRLARDRT